MPTKRPYKLTHQQLATLNLLYKFRFITAPLFHTYRHAKYTESIRINLERLHDRGLVSKRYDKSFRLQGKAAIYSLAAPALAILKSDPELNPKVLHSMYRNRNASDSFIEEHLDILRIFLVLRARYPTLTAFTRAETHDLDYFPDKKPDLYIETVNDGTTQEYFLYHITERIMYQIEKRLKPVLEHYENEGWDGPYPALLLVVQTAAIENRLISYFVDRYEDEDLSVLLTTKKALLDNATSKVWTDFRTELMLRGL